VNRNQLIAAALLFVLAYLPSVWLGLRRKKLHGALRWFFALTILPIFAALMWLNLWIADHLFSVERVVTAARDFDERHEGLATALSLFGVDIETHGLVAVAVSAPLAVLLAWLWYRLLVWLDRRRRQRAI
jgi:hypothetical protein